MKIKCFEETTASEESVSNRKTAAYYKLKNIIELNKIFSTTFVFIQHIVREVQNNKFHEVLQI